MAEREYDQAWEPDEFQSEPEHAEESQPEPYEQPGGEIAGPKGQVSDELPTDSIIKGLKGAGSDELP